MGSQRVRHDWATNTHTLTAYQQELMRYTTYLDQSKNTEKWSQINGHKISVKELLFSRQVISDYNPMDCCTPGFPVTVSQNLPKFMSITLMMPISHLILCYPLLLMPSIFPSIRVFSSESALCIRWWKYWSFGFSIISYWLIFLG